MDATEQKRIENLFVQEELDQHGEFLMDLLVEAIEAKDLVKTQALMESMYYTVNKREGNNSLTLNLFGYGRAIEIRYHTSKNSRKLEKVNTNQLLWKARGHEVRKKRKDTRWYSHNVYGSLNRLFGRIAWGLSEQEKERLKKILEAAGERGKINLNQPVKTFAV